MTKKEKILKLLESSNFIEETKQYLEYWTQRIQEFVETVQEVQDQKEDVIFFNPDELTNIVSLEEFLEICVTYLENELNEEEIGWLTSIFEHPLGKLFTETFPDLLDKALDLSVGQLTEKTERKLVELGIILPLPEEDSEDLDLDDSIT